MTNKELLIKIPIGIATFTSCSGFHQDNLEDIKPNIVMIIADDLGVPQLGCYGSDYYKTPNINKLAAEGIRFTQAYSAGAVCSPTRASIMTGKYPARLHLTDFIKGNKNPMPLKQPDWQPFLKLEEYTIAEALKQVGYSTALFGKWHLSCEKMPPKSLKYNPDKQGFDESFITYKPASYMQLSQWQTPDNDAHNVDTITSRGIDFIVRNTEKPFFLIISHNSVHDPLMEDSALIKKYLSMPDSEKEENNPVLAAMIETLDKSVGRIIEAIQTLGLEERTIVIFYSDNGGIAHDALQTPFREGKAWLYEGGVRVPLIIKWKNKVIPNSISEEPVSSIDFMPTFLKMAGYNDSDTLLFDGIDISPILKGAPINKRELFWNRPHYHSTGSKPGCAVRSGDYKLIEWYEGKFFEDSVRYELYNLKNDIGEINNLATMQYKKVTELSIILDTWKKEVNAQEPTVNKEKDN